MQTEYVGSPQGENVSISHDKLDLEEERAETWSCCQRELTFEFILASLYQILGMIRRTYPTIRFV